MVARGGEHWLEAALVAALSFSGCLGGPGPGPAAGTAPVGLEGPAFGPPDLIGGGGAVETSISIGRDGSMLVCEMGGGVANPVWSSVDDGRTWRAEDPFPAGTGPLFSNGDCDVAVGEGSWSVVYSTVVRGAGWPLVLLVATSSDRGSTWRVGAVQPPAACGTPFVGVPGFYSLSGTCLSMDRPWLQAVGRDLFLTYNDGIWNPFLTVFQKSSDGGATWSPPIVAAASDDAERPQGRSGRFLVEDGGRTIFVPVLRFGLDLRTGRAGDVWLGLAVSRDGGVTWQSEEVEGRARVTNWFLPSLARGRDGELYYPVPRVHGGTDAGADVDVLVSRDDGRNWGQHVVVGENVTFRPALPYVGLEARPAGGVEAVWQHWGNRSGVSGWIVSGAGVGGAAEPGPLWSKDLTGPAGKSRGLEFLGVARNPAAKLHVVYPIPEAPCPAGGRDCVYHLAES